MSSVSCVVSFGLSARASNPHGHLGTRHFKCRPISLSRRKRRALPVALSSGKIRDGQPLDNGAPGAGFDVQAVRAWEIAVRLREQAARFRVEGDIGETFPESWLELEALEAGIQTTARRLSLAANISAMSLEVLITLSNVTRACRSCPLGRFEKVSNKASRRGRFFGRRQHRLVAMDERPREEEELPNPMRREMGCDGWSCRGSLNLRRFKMDRIASY